MRFKQEETKDTTPSQTIDAAGEKAGKESNDKRFNRNQFPRNNNLNDLCSFAGDTPKLDAVLSLISERPDKEVSFEKFQERLKIYILKNFERSENVVKLVTNLEDPTDGFENTHMPPDLDDPVISEGKKKL